MRGCLSQSWRLCLSILAILGPAVRSRGAEEFFVPADPPNAQYKIESRMAISDKSVILEGTESISFKSTAAKPLSVLAVDWSIAPSRSIEISVKGTPLRLLNVERGLSTMSPLFYELPRSLPPGGPLEVQIKFSRRFEGNLDRISLQKWHPTLWWEAIPTRGSYKVKFDSPPGYVMALSGRLNKESGYYENEGVTTTFGIYLARDMKTAEREVEGVLLTALFTKEGEETARLCLDTAADVIHFYKGWLGFFPFKSLSIIPGGAQPVGGYPFASALVVIHGQEKFKQMPLLHWKWITAHEVGHQYWGEHVMSGDYPYSYTSSWLMIGMGICTDKAYVLSRNLGLEKHLAFFSRYLEGVRRRNDTTIDAAPTLQKTQTFDLNNVVIHGKGFAVLSALESVLGQAAFEKILKRCLKDYGGKRLAFGEFRRVCESEGGQDLGWFFEQWVRSSKYLCYQIASQERSQDGDKHVTKIRVEIASDSIQMPVPLKAVFEDGSSQMRTTDRHFPVNLFRFESRSRLKEVILNPDNRLAMLREPLPILPAGLPETISELPWIGSGKDALRILSLPEAQKIDNPDLWLKLGMLLFDGGYYGESIAAFKKLTELNPSRLLFFTALVWIGHNQDLLGEREKAIASYKEALKYDTGQSMQHSQYGMFIDRRWVEDRLQRPFKGANK